MSEASADNGGNSLFPCSSRNLNPKSSIDNSQSTIHNPHPRSIPRTKKQLDDGGGGEDLAGAGRHLEQEPIFAGSHCPLQHVYSTQLVGAQDA